VAGLQHGPIGTDGGPFCCATH